MSTEVTLPSKTTIEHLNNFMSKKTSVFFGVVYGVLKADNFKTQCLVVGAGVAYMIIDGVKQIIFKIVRTK